MTIEKDGIIYFDRYFCDSCGIEIDLSILELCDECQNYDDDTHDYRQEQIQRDFLSLSRK